MAKSITDSINDIDDAIQDLEDVLGTPVEDPIQPSNRPAVNSTCSNVKTDCENIINQTGGLNLTLLYSPPSTVAGCLTGMQAQRDALKNADTDSERRDAAQLEWNYAATMQAHAA
jgi:hypothetical protein